MREFIINSVGYIKTEDGFRIKLNKEYTKALKGLNDFKYIQVIYWFDKVDNEKSRNTLIENKPYKKGPEELGVFATRSPSRPNPIAIETVYIINIDEEKGIIEIPHIDAFDNTPVIDIKPYTPSIDRVENPIIPSWCSHWPKNYETSGEFNWEDEFNF